MIEEIIKHTELNPNLEFQSPNWSIGLTSNPDFTLRYKKFKKWRYASNRQARSTYNYFVENENFDCDTNSIHDDRTYYVYVFCH